MPSSLAPDYSLALCQSTAQLLGKAQALFVEYQEIKVNMLLLAKS